MHYVAHTGSRELFRLSVLAIALSVAFGAAELFGVSFALGAFFAGMILSESTLAQRAAEESLPLRDAFAVIFFVSVGMLFDPMILLREPWPVLATVLIIVFGKSIAAFPIVRAFGHSRLTAFTISASLAQIGEFSFILAALGVGLGLLPKARQDLILAGSILSILVNPAFFSVLDWFQSRSAATATDREASSSAAKEHLNPTSLTNHAVLVGFGRVGGLIGDALKGREWPFLAIEADHGRIERLRAREIEAISGNAARAELLVAANVAGARWLFVATPELFEAGQIVAQPRAANADLAIIARAYSDADEAHLRTQGASMVIMGEREIVGSMLQHAFGALAGSVVNSGAPPSV